MVRSGHRNVLAGTSVLQYGSNFVAPNKQRGWIDEEHLCTSRRQRSSPFGADLLSPVRYSPPVLLPLFLYNANKLHFSASILQVVYYKNYSLVMENIFQRK